MPSHFPLAAPHWNSTSLTNDAVPGAKSHHCTLNIFSFFLLPEHRSLRSCFWIRMCLGRTSVSGTHWEVSDNKLRLRCKKIITKTTFPQHKIDCSIIVKCCYRTTFHNLNSSQPTLLHEHRGAVRQSVFLTICLASPRLS